MRPGHNILFDHFVELCSCISKHEHLLYSFSSMTETCDCSCIRLQDREMTLAFKTSRDRCRREWVRSACDRANSRQKKSAHMSDNTEGTRCSRIFVRCATAKNGFSYIRSRTGHASGRTRRSLQETVRAAYRKTQRKGAVVHASLTKPRSARPSAAESSGTSARRS
jgi:hypothetical protein